jgi:RNA polymerase sigma factor (TIGR02999 family)
LLKFIAFRYNNGQGLVMKSGEGNKDLNSPAGDAENRKALNHLFSLTYEALRRLAAEVVRGDPGQTLNATALVNEAWMKLARSPNFVSTSELHFKRIAARAMRQVLVEAARRRKSGKRGRDVVIVTWGERDAGVATETEVLALHDALDRLAEISPRQADLVESRFFGGMETAEIAKLLDVSEATVLRDWRAAKAWLARELRSPG